IDVNNDTVHICSDTARIFLKVVHKALAEVTAFISSPLEATDRIVSIEQEFVVQAYLINHGQANFEGNVVYQLILPDGYATQQPLMVNLTSAEVAEWNIKAPSTEKPVANIEVRIPAGAGPRDENTNMQAMFLDDKRSSVIPVTTYQKTVQLSKLPDRTVNTVVKGQPNVRLLSLSFFNPKQDVHTNNLILTGFEVEFKDRLGREIANPAEVISRVAVCDYSDSTLVYGAVSQFSSGSRVRIDFFQPDTIPPDQTSTVSFIIDIAQATKHSDVMLAIPADTSIFINEAQTMNRPVIEGVSTGADFELASDFLVIMGDNLSESFRNYPNPFGDPTKPTTTITYFLKQDTDVDIKIYTLIGELVWSRSFKSSQTQGRAGTHDGDVIWDAKNDEGNTVLNGVYLIYLKTGFGETTTTKALLVK
ncbi:MAG: T9SS type A sorting domain-containing protein, partial [bacterium]|nr:T9SS type A sorting domain-containing protein [bacterium]